jgi:glycosyltransferase involved in cell wall biosynthesis
MPPIEAMAAGKPVVGVNEGYTRYQVEEDENGYLFDPDVDSVTNAVGYIKNNKWDPEQIMTMSKKFDVRVIRKKWIDFVCDMTEACIEDSSVHKYV